LQLQFRYQPLQLTTIGHGGGLWDSDGLGFVYDDKYGRLTREVYPNGRAVQYAYDAANRLASVTDPFGAVNACGYDDQGRLASLVHSTLGSAGMTYDAATDLLAAVTLPDGSATAYGYDALQRLTSLDVSGPAGAPARVIRQSWGYDALGRKDATAGVATTTGIVSTSAAATWAPAGIQFAYDAASRVTQEKLLRNAGGGATAEAWRMNYGYDQAGNRTALLARSLNLTLATAAMTYGAGNREAAATAGLAI